MLLGNSLPLRKSDFSPKPEDLEQSELPYNMRPDSIPYTETPQKHLAIKYSNLNFHHDLKLLLIKVNLEIFFEDSVAIVTSNPSELKHVFHYLLQGVLEGKID